MNESSKPRFFYGYIMVAVTLLILMIKFGASYSFGVFFKPVITEFGWTRAMFAGAASLGSLLGAPLGIVWGRINDRFGPRIVISIVGMSTVLAYLLMAQMSAIWHLYLTRGIILAVGGGGLMVALVPTISRWFVKRRGLMTGVALAGIGIGTIIVAPLSDWLIVNYGWRNCFLVLGIASTVVILLAQFLRRDPSKIGQTAYGAVETTEPKADVQLKGLSLREALRTRQLWFLCATYFCFLFCVQVIYQHIVIHAIDLGTSSAGAATLLSVIGGANIFGRFIGGFTGDKFGNKKVLMISFIVLLCNFLWLIAAKEMWMLYIFAIIFGVSYGTIYTLEVPTIAGLFGVKALSSIVGIVNFSYISGIAVGPLLAGIIFDVTGSYQLAFIICSAITAIALTSISFIKPITTSEAIE